MYPWTYHSSGGPLNHPVFVVLIDIVQAVAATLSEAMTSLGPHISSLLRSRDLTKLTSGHLDHPGKGVYVGGQDIIKVMMEEAGEGGRPVAVLPPLDLHILQSKLAGGRLPPGYGLRDEYNCIKLALCQLCSSRLPANHEALKQVRRIISTISYDNVKCSFFFPQHVECARHQAKLGRVIVEERTVEEFRYVLSCSSSSEMLFFGLGI